MCKSLSVFKSNNIGICGDGACLFLFFQRTAHKKQMLIATLKFWDTLLMLLHQHLSYPILSTAIFLGSSNCCSRGPPRTPIYMQLTV